MASAHAGRRPNGSARVETQPVRDGPDRTNRATHHRGRWLPVPRLRSRGGARTTLRRSERHGHRAKRRGALRAPVL